MDIDSFDSASRSSDTLSEDTVDGPAITDSTRSTFSTPNNRTRSSSTLAQASSPSSILRILEASTAERDWR
jgi:hypothetical protein